MKINLQLNSPFTKSVLTLVTGNTVAMVIPILLYPLLSRIFSPGDYAVYGLFISLFSVLEIGSAGRYDFAIVMPEDDESAINLVYGGLIISLFYSLFVLLVIMAGNQWIANALGNPLLTNWLYILPFTLLFASIGKLFNSWLIRKKKFRASSFNKASQKITETSSQLAIGFFALGNGLIIGDFLGRFFTAFLSFYQSVKANFNRRAASKKEITNMLKRFIEFPKFNILPSMLNSLAGMVPVFLISARYNLEVSGSFNFSRIVLAVPFSLIASGISQVLMQLISERKNKREPVASELFSLFIKLVVVSIIAVILLFFAAPMLFEFIFGIKWRLSGEFTSILIFSNAIAFVISPFSILLAVLDKIKYSGIWQVFYFAASCSLWLFNDLGIERFLLLLVIVDMLSYLVYGFLIYLSVKQYEEGLTIKS